MSTQFIDETAPREDPAVIHADPSPTGVEPVAARRQPQPDPGPADGIAPTGLPPHDEAKRVLRIYSHSSFLFWWPIWAVGFFMALLTYWSGEPHQIEGVAQAAVVIHPSSNLGVIFFLTLFLIIMITNFSVRGLASGIVVMGSVLLTVVLAYIGWWDSVFSWFGNLTIHLTMGAYFWFSALMFLAWAVTVFGVDRLSYWEITPGQITHKRMLGSGANSYNAQGMGMEKHRDDIFRHWLLGLGSGDLTFRTSGATREQFDLANVLFVDSKVESIQRLIAAVPEEVKAS